jgi:hypothetical protein
MGDHARNAALRRRMNFGQRMGPPQEAKEVRGCAPGEEGPFPTSLDRCHVAGFEARCLVAHPENPAMNADQGAGLDPLQELRLTHPSPKHLLARHYAVGSPSQLGENSLDCPALGRH